MIYREYLEEVIFKLKAQNVCCGEQTLLVAIWKVNHLLYQHTVQLCEPGSTGINLKLGTIFNISFLFPSDFEKDPIWTNY